LAQFADRLIYVEDEDGVEWACALRLDDNRLLAEYGLLHSDGLLLSVVATTRRHENTGRAIEYILAF